MRETEVQPLTPNNYLFPPLAVDSNDSINTKYIYI